MEGLILRVAINMLFSFWFQHHIKDNICTMYGSVTASFTALSTSTELMPKAKYSVGPSDDMAVGDK